jgi:hypothetical protein
MNIVPELFVEQGLPAVNINDKIVDDILFVCEFYGVPPHEIMEYEIPQFFIMRNFAWKLKTEEANMINKMKKGKR